MSLDTFSTFYYGHEITSDNNKIDFDEGFGERVAEIGVKTYSLSQFIVAVQDALNSAGSNVYVVTMNRNTRRITITADNPFDLLTTTGDHLGTSAFSLMGFSGADHTGGTTYTGSGPSGSEYRPQFILQDHIPPENFKKSVQATVNESASGVVEIVRFGSVRFLQLNIMYITNIPMDGKIIRSNPSGVDDANSFMDYITKIAPIEFMPDVSDKSFFNTIQLESTPQNKDGIDYTLKELYDKNLPNIFETGKLVFRVLD